MINVVVVDDHDLVRSAIVKLLATAPDIQVIAEIESGEAAVKIVQEKTPSVVLMDLSLPGMDGLETTHQILQNNPEIKVIILTAYSNTPWPKKLLQAGASGYLTKEASVEELINAVRTVHTGKHYISPSIAQELALHTSLSIIDVLSDREQQVMVMITNGAKVQAIAEQLNISPKTVNTYRYRLYEKLEVNSDVELTLLAIRHGMLETA